MKRAALSFSLPLVLTGAAAVARTAVVTALLAVLTGAQAAPRDPEPTAVATAVAEYLERLRETRALPGVSAALVLADGTELAQAVGRAGDKALAPDDLMLSGSIGKTYVSALALLLERDGKLELDDRLAEYLGRRDWFARLPNGPELTLRHLLRHQSGLLHYVNERAFWTALMAEPDRVRKPEEQVAFVLDRAPAFAPGAGFRYSDTNYLLVGMALEAAAQRPFYSLVRERLLEPHGLRRTLPSDARSIPGLVQGTDELFRELGVPEHVLGPDGRFAVNPGFEWCGGGFASTALDLARWARILYGPGGEAALLDAVPAPELGADVRYGLGVILRRTSLGELRGHDGVMLGYTSRMGWFPEHGVAVAVQTNISKQGALSGDVLVDLAQLALPDRR
jgi:D-alanyl-D-alanine carboxypeptidase